MQKKHNPKLIQHYMTKYQMNQHFSQDMTPYIELFFWKKNEHICREDEHAEYLFFFVDGKAKVYITLQNGKSLLLCFYEEFKLIGDIEIINGKNSTANVQAIEECYCLGIKREIVSQYLLRDVIFLRFMCESLSHELERSSKNSSINLLYPLENRLASYLYTTISHDVTKQEDTPIFQENLTALAELLGTSYRHLHRSIDSLCKKKIIERTPQGIKIVNEDELKALTFDLYQ